jgi:hypothetical protein
MLSQQRHDVKTPQGFREDISRVRLKPDGAREGKGKGNWPMECVASTLILPQNVMYPALQPLMRTTRLPAVY